MSNTKTLRSGAGAGELASLLTQLKEKIGQMQRLLAQVEEVSRGTTASGKANRATESAVTPARKSPLDQVKSVMELTSDLREANGNLSAVRVAKVFGVSLSQLAGWLGRT